MTSEHYDMDYLFGMTSERYDKEYLFNKAIEHYFQMAQIPGCKEYAWGQVKEWQRAWPDVYTGLPEALAAKMKELHDRSQ